MSGVMSIAGPEGRQGLPARGVLIGKMVVVANLKPARLTGVESRGMLLATDADAGLTILACDRPPKTGAGVR